MFESRIFFFFFLGGGGGGVGKFGKYFLRWLDLIRDFLGYPKQTEDPC